MSHHVYVLLSAPACRFYIGVTANVATRLAQHNLGESRWTKRYAGSWELVWSRPAYAATADGKPMTRGLTLLPKERLLPSSNRGLSSE